MPARAAARRLHFRVGLGTVNAAGRRSGAGDDWTASGAIGGVEVVRTGWELQQFRPSDRQRSTVRKRGIGPFLFNLVYI